MKKNKKFFQQEIIDEDGNDIPCENCGLFSYEHTEKGFCPEEFYLKRNKFVIDKKFNENVIDFKLNNYLRK